MRPTAWTRWLGVSVTAHAVVIAGVWTAFQVTRQEPFPQPLTSAIAVSLVDPWRTDQPVPVAHPVPTRIVTATEPDVTRSSPGRTTEDDTPSPESGLEPLSAPVSSPQNSDELVEQSPTLASPEEPPLDSAVGNSSGFALTIDLAAHSNYRQRVLAILDRAKRYPTVLQRRGWEGRVAIEFRIGPDGKISDVEVIRPSDYPMLDEATLTSVRRIGSLPAPPDRNPLRFPATIEYKLDSITSSLSTEGARP